MIKLPTNQNRLAVIGMTGTGKTVAGLWHLSKRDYDRTPWIVLDFKRDENIARIPGHVILDVRAPVPTQPGIYVVQPLPRDEDEVEALLWRIWATEHVGLFIDEGYMINRMSEALRAILTQGRSKRIPVIMLSQRPAWVCPFLLSESEYIQMFFIHNPADIARMRDWLPWNGQMPPRFHSYYYQVGDNKLSLLKPVPAIPAIMETFRQRLPQKRKLF